MTKQFDNKLVAVLNKSIEHGKVMNALAHMSIGFGSVIEQEPLELIEYVDMDNESHPYISKMPFMILRSNNSKIRNLRQEAIAAGIKYVDFTDTMTVGSYQDQLDRTKQTKEEDLIYFGIVLFGDWDKISELTGKFSLWK